MKRWFFRRGDVLAPSDEDSLKSLRRLEEGEAVQIMTTRSRSPKWHRWYMGCCREIGLNMDPVRSEHTIDYALRFWSGHVEEVRDLRGRVMEVAQRIAFDKLTADGWEKLWPALEQTMIEKFGFDPVRFKEYGEGWVHDQVA